jgi:hypothetical protein
MFFVGERGAAQTARYAEDLAREIRQVTAEVKALLRA